MNRIEARAMTKLSNRVTELEILLKEERAKSEQLEWEYNYITS